MLEQTLVKAWPTASWIHTDIVVCVSGGADSVALLRALVNISTRPELLHAVHFNHQWRGAESDRDEHFVRRLSESLAVDLTVGRADERGHSLLPRSEQAARTARYEFISEFAYRVGARYVVTAHTANDRIETMLHNLCRGTGISGVSTPTRVRPLGDELVLVRPLLTASRNVILDYLSLLGQEFCEDSSNLNTAYKRNYIRHKLLPQMREVYGPQVDKHLYAFSEMAEQYRGALTYYAQRWLSNSCTIGKENSMLRSAILAEPWPVVQLGLELLWKSNRWPLQAMTRQHWDLIREIASDDDDSTTWRSRLNLPSNLFLFTKRDWIKIVSPKLES